MTLNDRKCQNASKCLLGNGTESKNNTSYILQDNFNAFGFVETQFFCRERGRVDLDCALVWVPGSHFLTKSPCGGPLSSIFQTKNLVSMVKKKIIGYRISSTGLRLEELILLPFLIQFDSFLKHNGNFSLINNMEYIYIMTLNDRKCQNASKCLLGNGTESKNNTSYILQDNFNAFGFVETQFFCRERGRVDLDCALVWVPGSHFLTKSPCGVQGGLDWTEIAHAQLNHGTNNMRP